MTKWTYFKDEMPGGSYNILLAFDYGDGTQAVIPEYHIGTYWENYPEPHVRDGFYAWMPQPPWPDPPPLPEDVLEAIQE